MSEPVGFGSFEELDLCHNLGSQPDCCFNRLGVEFTVEAGGMCLAILKRAITICESIITPSKLSIVRLAF